MANQNHMHSELWENKDQEHAEKLMSEEKKKWIRHAEFYMAQLQWQ